MDIQTQVTLTRLLSRLEAQQAPRTSYERAKAQRNVEHARTLLLTLEKQSATIRVQSQRQEIQADLQRKRESIKELTARLQAAAEEDSEEEEDDEDDDGETEDEKRRGVSYEPAIKDTDSGLDTGQTPAMQAEVLSQQAQALQEQSQPSELRSRRHQHAPLQASDNRSAASTTAREQLFAGRPKDPPPSSNLSKSETLLSHNRNEQENLTTSLLSLASALKQSSLQFSSSLETEKDVLRRAEGGLDKSAQGMEAAERKMGALRRMSEGQGLWGRLKLYGFIFALWVACFLLVFVGPKIRL